MSMASDGISRLFIARMGGRITVTDLEGKELYSFGGPGSELDGKLLEPSGMHYHDGHLYVADSWYSKVLILTPKGEIVDVYGESGRGTKEFFEPKGIFIYHGLIFISDTGNSRIQVLGPNGTYLREFGIEGGKVDQSRGPGSMVVRGKGMAYVIDDLDSWVKLYDMRGEFFGKMSNLKKPVSIALAGRGVVVADAREGALIFFDSRNKLMGMIGPWGANGSPFKKVTGIVSVGDLYFASDLEGNDIKVFRVPGLGGRSGDDGQSIIPWAEYLGEKVVPGQSPGKLERTLEGKLYFLDRDTGRIFRFVNGTEIERAGTEDCTATSFTVGPDGDIYCLDAEKGKVIVAAVDGTVRKEIALRGPVGPGTAARSPVDISVSAGGDIFIADRGLGKVLVYGAEGDYRGPLGVGGTSFYIKDPVALRVDGRNMIYVLDAVNGKVYIYSTTGRLIREFWDIGKLSKPVGLSVSDDYIYLLDLERPDIKVFTKTGMHVMSFGSRGSGKGEFSSPVSVETDAEGRLLVSDTGNRRIQSLGMHIPPEYVMDMWRSKSVKQGEIGPVKRE
jgi:outer membrane protein assembly factor BamB